MVNNQQLRQNRRLQKWNIIEKELLYSQEIQPAHFHCQKLWATITVSNVLMYYMNSLKQNWTVIIWDFYHLVRITAANTYIYNNFRSCYSSHFTNTFGRENTLIASSTSHSLASNCSLAFLTLIVSLLIGSAANFEVSSLWPGDEQKWNLYYLSMFVADNSWLPCTFDNNL